MDIKQSIEIKNVRFSYIDNFRSFVILLVIIGHTAIAYCGMGTWPYMEGSLKDLNQIESSIFTFLACSIQWTMCSLFLISAFFITKSLKRRSTKSFIRDRLFRLGIPVLFYIFIIHPFIYAFLLRGDNAISWSYIKDWYTHFLFSYAWLNACGPIWFCAVLLFFSIIYAIIRQFFAIREMNTKIFQKKNILFFIVLAGIATFLLRIEYPIGGIYICFNNLPFFPLYIAMFILGVIVGENNLLDKISDERNVKWFKWTLIIGYLSWVIIMLFSGVNANIIACFRKSFQEGIAMLFSQSNTVTAHLGGFNWQSFAFTSWDAFFTFGLSIGIIALFRKKLNIENKFTKLLAENSFCLFVFHPPVQIAVLLSLKNIELSMGLKFLIAAAITLIACFVFCILIRKIKIVRILFN